jgi:hypothetical protein
MKKGIVKVQAMGFPKSIFKRIGTCAILTATLAGSTPCHATMFILLCDNTEIVIASDSRRITIDHGQKKTQNGVEKVVSLGPGLAFMTDGFSEITTTQSEIRPMQIARAAVASATRASRRPNMEEIAIQYGESLTESFSLLSDQSKAQLQSALASFGSGGGPVLESIFAGRDSDGKLKIEMVDVVLQGHSESESLQFVWTHSERIPTNDTDLILSGDVKSLQAGFESSSSPIGQLPSFQSWVAAIRAQQHLNKAQSAEALANLSLKYKDPNDSSVGYPIFVYAIDSQGGFKKLKTVTMANAVNLPH